MKVITLMDLRKNGWGIEEEFGLKKNSSSDNYIDKLIDMANR